jgi:ribosome-associated protein
VADPKPSKSERKREQLELQTLGEKLAALPDEALKALGLGERLHEALLELRHMKAHGAVRRQKQLIGKLMRAVDPVPIRALFIDRAEDLQRERRIFMRAERWRDRLRAEGRTALEAFRDETSASTEAIERILEELATTRHERTERQLNRKLFREIHAVLVARPVDG